MKRSVLLILALLTCCGAFADKIITTAADIIECTVSEIGDDVVKYRKPDETFVREIARTKVFKIKYDSGSEDVLKGDSRIATEQSAPEPAQQSGLVSTEPNWSTFAPAPRDYHIGDWYSENGVEGVVIYTTDDFRHGIIINKKKFGAGFKQKALFTGPTNIAIGMNDRLNGYANMLALKAFMTANPQYTADMFPVQQVLDGLGDGWYLPAIDEVDYFFNLSKTTVAYTGENTKFCGKTVAWGKIFNSVSKQHGGSSHNEDYLLSSTEVYSQGGASAPFRVLYGDTDKPQYAVLKYDVEITGLVIKPVARNEGKVPFYAFHIF